MVWRGLQATCRSKLFYSQRVGVGDARCGGVTLFLPCGLLRTACYSHRSKCRVMDVLEFHGPPRGSAAGAFCDNSRWLPCGTIYRGKEGPPRPRGGLMSRPRETFRFDSIAERQIPTPPSCPSEPVARCTYGAETGQWTIVKSTNKKHAVHRR